jgi:hypothetical protein
VAPTSVEKILRVKDAQPPADIRDRAQALIQYAFGDRDDELRTALFEAVEPPPPTEAVAASASNGHGDRLGGTRTVARPRRLLPEPDSTAVH